MPIYFMWQSSHDPSFDNLMLNLMLLSYHNIPTYFPQQLCIVRFFPLTPSFDNLTLQEMTNPLPSLLCDKNSKALQTFSKCNNNHLVQQRQLHATITTLCKNKFITPWMHMNTWISLGMKIKYLINQVKSLLFAPLYLKKIKCINSIIFFH